MRFQIGIDVGGTFTDFVASDDAGGFFTGKVMTTPHEEARGILNAVAAIAEHYHSTLSDLLNHTDVIVPYAPG